jgi:spore maturation protein SpmB
LIGAADGPVSEGFADVGSGAEASVGVAIWATGSGAAAAAVVDAVTAAPSDDGHIHQVAPSATTSTMASHQGERVRCVTELAGGANVMSTRRVG